MDTLRSEGILDLFVGGDAILGAGAISLVKTVGGLRSILRGSGACWVFSIGFIISHTGSDGLPGSEHVDMGLSRTSVELSQSWSMRGEYAGVEGSESMNVPILRADIGGDIGPGVRGLM